MSGDADTDSQSHVMWSRYPPRDWRVGDCSSSGGGPSARRAAATAAARSRSAGADATAVGAVTAAPTTVGGASVAHTSTPLKVLGSLPPFTPPRRRHQLAAGSLRS
jgi:hypothetical protein